MEAEITPQLELDKLQKLWTETILIIMVLTSTTHSTTQEFMAPQTPSHDKFTTNSTCFPLSKIKIPSFYLLPHSLFITYKIQHLPVWDSQIRNSIITTNIIVSHWWHCPHLPFTYLRTSKISWRLNGGNNDYY